ncbi:MAG TPA: DinB family protein [Acidimicrobiales bacterium]|nr:DinB family protein [Acidimicrobiales bacterium]
MPEPNSIAQANERDALNGFLDVYRGVVERKVTGLSRADAVKELTPTGLSPLGVIKHLGWVEYYWFRHCFAGEEVDAPPREGGDNAVQFRVGPDENAISVLDFYRSECRHSREVASMARSLDELSTRENPYFGRVNLRWILIHMVEETARHAGHLDIIREMIDGDTGYL